MVHKSHISSREANTRGWSRVPSSAVREETLNLSKEVGSDYMSEQYLVMNSASNTMQKTSLAANATNTWYYPVSTWQGQWDTAIYSPTITIKEIIQKKEVTKEVEERTLFAVYVVDPKKNGKILLDGKKVIAVNENQAMLKAGVAEIAEKAGLELEQVDVYVQTIGTFIRPRKETQKVRITKEEDE